MALLENEWEAWQQAGADAFWRIEEELNSMTIGEFRAWLEGFGEAMGSSPNIKQWKKIQERLESVHDGCNHHYNWWPTWYCNTERITEAIVPCGTNDSSGTTTIYAAATEIGRLEAGMTS